MKKILLGILLGILFLKSSHTVYSYYWWSYESSSECIKLDTEQLEACIGLKMGYIKYLAYPLLNLDYTYHKWQLRY